MFLKEMRQSLLSSTLTLARRAHYPVRKRREFCGAVNEVNLFLPELLLAMVCYHSNSNTNYDSHFL